MVLTKNMKYTFIQALSKTLLNTDFILEISLGINSHSNNNTTFFNTYYRLSTFLSMNSFIIQSSGLICGLCPHILASRLQNSCLSSSVTPVFKAGIKGSMKSQGHSYYLLAEHQYHAAGKYYLMQPQGGKMINQNNILPRFPCSYGSIQASCSQRDESEKFRIKLLGKPFKEHVHVPLKFFFSF